MSEILNNIWSALIVENQALLSIILIPIFFVDNAISLLLFISILKIELSKKQKILYIVLSSIVGIIIRYSLPEPINVFIIYIFLFIELKFIFKINTVKSILATILPIFTYTILETVLLKFYLTIFNITPTIAQSVPIYRFGFLFIMYSIICIICAIVKHFDFKIIILDEFNKRTKLILLITLILGLISLGIQLYITIFHLNVLPLFICIFSFISLLAYFSVSIYTITRVTKLYSTKRDLENAEEYNRTLNILHDKVRTFKHNFENIVSTIGGYIETNDMEGLKKYYSELEDDCQRVNNLYNLSPNVINNPGIYNLLTRKYYKADNLNVKVNLIVLLDLNQIKMQIYEFSKILGILLDNAIEASSECEEKVINIKFLSDEKNHRQLLIIENTYKNKDINLKEIFNKDVTSKENHSGLGLWEIKEILKRNNNLDLKTEKNEQFFIQQFEIHY